MDSPITFAPAILGLESGIHWIILLVVALLLFGRRLPEIMRGLGGSIREFKKGIDEGGGNLDTSSKQPDGATSREATPHVTGPTPTVDQRVKTAQPADEPKQH
jgi:sec-independent protein translocase protein TatA